MHSCQPVVQIKRNKLDKKNLILCKKMSDNSSAHQIWKGRSWQHLTKPMSTDPLGLFLAINGHR